MGIVTLWKWLTISRKARIGGANDKSRANAREHHATREHAGQKGVHLVDEGTYFGRPVRMYSDGSVRAMTRRGWLHFSSLETFKIYHHDLSRRSNHNLKDL